MIERIKRKYANLNDKQGFCERLGEKMGKKGKSIFNHWFGTYLNIPLKHRSEVINELNKELRKQQRKVEKALKI